MRVSSALALACLLFAVSFCNAEFQIVGVAECADCQLNNVKTSHANYILLPPSGVISLICYFGLHVNIDCELEKGMKRVGEGDVDEKGKFDVSLPKEIVKQVLNLKKECYAQLQSAAAVPCPAHGGVEATKIVFKSRTNQKVVFAPAKALQFSTALCASKLLWPFFEYPPLTKMDPWKKDWPEITFPPLENFGQYPWSLPPTHKPKLKPLPHPFFPHHKPPPVPTNKHKPKPKEKPPVFKPLPPPSLVYKPTPKPPVFEPLPPKVPVYKPLPPSKPFYKPPVVSEPQPPVFPMFPFPPLRKKPCSPFAKIPPKNFDKPTFGFFPKLPPFNTNNT